MIKKITLLLPLVAFIFFGLPKEYGHSYSQQPPVFNAGAPNMSACSANGCHNSNDLDTPGGSATITLGESLSGYLPNTTYDITLTIERPGTSRYGFQMVAYDNNGASIGNFMTGGNENIGLNSSNDIQFVQHQSVPNNNSNVFSFEWTSPDAGAGTVTFYTAANAANGNGNAMGDFIHRGALEVVELDPNDSANWVTAIEDVNVSTVQVYPNPVVDQLNIENAEAIQALLLFDVKGNLLESHTDQRSVLDLGGKYPTGIYFLQIVEEERTTNKRIVVL